MIPRDCKSQWMQKKSAALRSFVLCPAPQGKMDHSGHDTELSANRLRSRLPSTYETNPEIIYIRKEQLKELYAAIYTLSPRHHAWIICRYGFDDDVYKSLAEMSKIYHMSESKAKKTEDDAIGKLRKELWRLRT